MAAFGAPLAVGAAFAEPEFYSTTPSGTQTSAFGEASIHIFGSATKLGGGGISTFSSTGDLGQDSKALGSASAPAALGTRSMSTISVNNGFVLFASSGNFVAAVPMTGLAGNNILGPTTPCTPFSSSFSGFGGDINRFSAWNIPHDYGNNTRNTSSLSESTYIEPSAGSSEERTTPVQPQHNQFSSTLGPVQLAGPASLTEPTSVQINSWPQRRRISKPAALPVSTGSLAAPAAVGSAQAGAIVSAVGNGKNVKDEAPKGNEVYQFFPREKYCSC
jgi:hypothetical protein